MSSETITDNVSASTESEAAITEAAPQRPRMTQQKRSSISTRKLLQATADLIAERGYEGTTLIEIGKRAGYSHGLVTRRFGTKANLVQSLIATLSKRFGHVEMSQTVGDAVGIDAIDTLLLSIRMNAEESPQSLRGFYALMFESLKPAVGLQEYVSGIHRDFLADVETVVALGAETGRLAEGANPRELAELMMNLLRGLAFRWMLDGDEVDFVAGIDSIRRALDTLAAPAD
ncbi:TetR/AcrR family transcriptional regulator [Microbacterium sp. A93]|uniref:TetR/AcrR family transcriptional regulator n=1 Tax=Microbacterium sp. A93 TaxID=3450716 RepID=UPI003F4232F9